jgi:hypothetical protein
MDDVINSTMEDTRRKLLENFDAEVHDRLRINMEQSREYLDRYSKLLWELTRHELGKRAKFNSDYLNFDLQTSIEGIDVPTGHYYMARQGIEGHRYRLGHPLAQHVLAQAADRQLNTAEIVFGYTGWRQKSIALEPFLGKTGILAAQKLSIRGVDDQDHILLAANLDDGTPLDPKNARRLFDLPIAKTKIAWIDLGPPEKLNLDAQRNKILSQVNASRAKWFDEEIEKLDCWADDLKVGLEFEIKEIDKQIKEARRASASALTLEDKLTGQKNIKSLEGLRNQKRRSLFDAQDEVDKQKADLISQIEGKLEQEVETHPLFVIRWSIQ